MIYKILIVNDYNEQRQFALAAKDDRELYRRILSQYGISKDKVEILEKYDIIKGEIKLVKSYINKIVGSYSDVDLELLTKAKELYFNSPRKSEPYKSQAIEKYNFKVVNITNDKDIIPLLRKYKKVKVYWDITEKRGEHSYYALVK